MSIDSSRQKSPQISSSCSTSTSLSRDEERVLVDLPLGEERGAVPGRVQRGAAAAAAHGGDGLAGGRAAAQAEQQAAGVIVGLRKDGGIITLMLY